MKKIFLSCLFVIVCELLFGHEKNEAFFDFVQKGNEIEVKAELPWTMRNALILYNPILEKSKSRTDFENTFLDYIRKNLIIKDKKGNELYLKGFEEIENNGHSHQNSFLIYFKGSDLFEVSNTIMFNLSENQVNYNTVAIDSRSNVFKTTKSQPFFKLVENRTRKYFWYMGFLFIPLLYIFNRYINNKI